MSKRKRELKSRIGRCANGRVIDLPMDLTNEKIVTFIQSFNIAEMADLLCMTEAIFIRTQRRDKQAENTTLHDINRYLRQDPLWQPVHDHLITLGLVSSFDYVRYGQTLLLGL